MLGSTEARRLLRRLPAPERRPAVVGPDPEWLANAMREQAATAASEECRISLHAAIAMRCDWPAIAPAMALDAGPGRCRRSVDRRLAAGTTRRSSLEQPCHGPDIEPVAEPLDFTVAVLAQAPGAVWDADERPLSDRFAAAARLAAAQVRPGPTGVLQRRDGHSGRPRGVGACLADGGLSARAGKLRATVPPHAHGFAIGTPKLDLVDLGTEFGVQVDEQQATEVHVFTGKVDLYDAGSNRAVASRKELTTGQGLLSDEPRRCQSRGLNPGGLPHGPRSGGPHAGPGGAAATSNGWPPAWICARIRA